MHGNPDFCTMYKYKKNNKGYIKKLQEVVQSMAAVAKKPAAKKPAAKKPVAKKTATKAKK